MKILIPLDGSETGETALPYVNTILSELSPRVKVEFILIRVVPLLTHYVAAGEVATPIFYTEKEMEQIQQEARDYLGAVSEKVSDKVSVEIVIKVGSAADEIIKAADEIGVDLIAMSTHGRHGISRWAFGSVTDKVLRAGNKPVLVVRAPKQIDQK
jgi:nucleotide-binding universal stress UspA family protein